MTRYQRREPTRVEEKLIDAGMTCDICGAATDDDHWDWKDPRKKHHYTDPNIDGNYCKVTVEAEIGDVYPEGDLRDTYSIDICPGCFLDKVKPAIEALGGKFAIYDTEDHYKGPPAQVLPAGVHDAVQFKRGTS
jgi:hypothetical protein